MEIKVFGPGCARCVEAENVVRQAAEQAGGEISVLKVSDFREIMAARIISTPAVMVNGQIIASGTPAQVRADAGVQAAYLGEEHG